MKFPESPKTEKNGGMRGYAEIVVEELTIYYNCTALIINCSVVNGAFSAGKLNSREEAKQNRREIQK